MGVSVSVGVCNVVGVSMGVGVGVSMGVSVGVGEGVGVSMGVSVWLSFHPFQLVSLLPARIMRLLEFVGFTGNKVRCQNDSLQSILYFI